MNFSNKITLRIISFCILFILSVLPWRINLANADYVSPALINVSTASYGSQNLIYTPGKYKYAIRWEGIPVASAEIVVGEPPQLIRNDIVHRDSQVAVRVSVRTSKGIDLLYKLRHTSESIFDQRSLKPVAFTSDQTENSKFKRFEVEFRNNHEILSRFYKKPSALEPDERSEFNSANFTLDPIFGALLARSVPVDKGSEVDFDIWNGKHRYLIKFKVVGREEITVGKNKVLADKVIPTVNKLTDSEGEKRIKSCVMWVSADERREILKVESKVLLGSITASLSGIEPAALPAPNPPVVQASKPLEPSETPSRAMLQGPTKKE